MRYLTVSVLVLSTLLGCSGMFSAHDCSLTPSEEERMGQLAPFTKGADMCFVQSGKDELVASYYDTTYPEVATLLDEKFSAEGWTVEVNDFQSERMNGKPLDLKLISAEKDGKRAVGSAYELTEGIVEVSLMWAPPG